MRADGFLEILKGGRDGRGQRGGQQGLPARSQQSQASVWAEGLAVGAAVRAGLGGDGHLVGHTDTIQCGQVSDFHMSD